MTLDLKGRTETRPVHSYDSIRRRGLLGKLLLLVATIRTRGLLNRTLRPYRRGKSPPIPPYLRQDLGLPPEPPRANYWDHR